MIKLPFSIYGIILGAITIFIGTDIAVAYPIRGLVLGAIGTLIVIDALLRNVKTR